MNDNNNVFAEIISRLDRIEKALLAFFAAGAINQAADHDRLDAAVRNFVSAGENLKNVAARG